MQNKSCGVVSKFEEDRCIGVEMRGQNYGKITRKDREMPNAREVKRAYWPYFNVE